MTYTIELKTDHLIVLIINEDAKEEYLYRIKRVKRANRNKMLELFDNLIEDFLYHYYAVGTVIAKDENWNSICKIIEYIPLELVKGTHPETQTLSEFFLEQIEDNDDLLAELIFTSAWDKERKTIILDNDGTLTESGYLIKLNSLDFLELLSRSAILAQTRQMDRREKIESEIENSKKKITKK